MKQHNEFLRHNVSLKYLKETFYYKKGFLYWKERPRHHFETDWSWKRFNKNFANKKAAILDKQSGYNVVSFRLNGKKFKTKEHRIIWYIVNNEVPYLIDHIDRNRLNNNIENLRNTSEWENRLNQENFKGTNFHKASNKWVAQYTEGNKRLHLGLFNSEWDAIQAYRSKVKEHRGIDLNKRFIYQDINNWFKIAKPNPTKRDLIVQISCVIEELAELFEALNFKSEAEKLNKLVKNIRENKIEINTDNRQSILDAMADIKVTIIGMAKFLNMDLENALIEVNKSNYSKFENGKALTNEAGKIIKGKDYFKPNLEKFV